MSNPDEAWCNEPFSPSLQRRFPGLPLSRSFKYELQTSIAKPILPLEEAD